MATVFVNDTLTDSNGTPLHDHIRDDGGSWTQHPNAGADGVINANAQHATSTTLPGALYIADAAPGPDVEVKGTYLVKSVNADRHELCARMSSVNQERYVAEVATGAIRLLRYNSGGGSSTLGSYNDGGTFSLTDADEVILRAIEDPADDTNAIFSVLLNGVVIIGPVTETTTYFHTGIGIARGGRGASAGVHLDAFEATNIGEDPILVEVLEDESLAVTARTGPANLDTKWVDPFDAGDSLTIEVGWDRASPALVSGDTYELDLAYDAGGAPGSWNAHAVVGPNVLFRHVLEQQGNITWWRVRANRAVGGVSPYTTPHRQVIYPPPTGIGVTGLGSGEVSLSWNPPGQEASNELWYARQDPEQGGTPGNWLIAESGLDSSGTVEQLEPGTYYFRVRSFYDVATNPYVAEDAYSNFSEAVEVEVAGQVFSEPVIASSDEVASVSQHVVVKSTMEAEEDERADIHGTSSAGTIVFSEPVIAEGNEAVPEPPDTTILIFEPAEPLEDERFAASAINPPVSSWPVPIDLAASEIKPRTALLSWTEVDDPSFGAPDWVEVYQAPDVAGAPGAWTLIGEASGESFRVGVSGTAVPLDPETKYHFRIRSEWQAEGALSSFTDPISLTTPASVVVSEPVVAVGDEALSVLAINPPESAVADLAAIAVNGTTIKLTWTNPEGATGMRIHRSTSTGFTPGPENQVRDMDATLGEYLNPGLTPETTYFYKVVAYNAAGATAASNEASATTLAGLGLRRGPLRRGRRTLMNTIR